jgi:sugar/nucleoside kinase (ribokinase family)
VPDTEFDCLVCGTCTVDVLTRPVPLSEPPGAGRLFHVGPIEAVTGGLVCNAGVAMSRLGLRVAAVGLVGHDAWADVVRAGLAAEGIDATGMESRHGAATSTTVVLVDPSGERSFAHHVGACAALDAGFVERQVDLLTRCSWAMLGYFGLLPTLERSLPRALTAIRRAGCRTALDTAGDGGALADLAPALPLIDLFVPSLAEACRQTGLTDPRSIVDCYRAHGAAGIVGVKLGSRGALLQAADGAWSEIPCITAPAPVADTTGAGDAFLAGLVAGLVRGMALGEAGLLGAATAACCVTGVGATAGLRTLPETLALLPR